MTWQFYGGSLVQTRPNRRATNIVFFFCMDPKKFLTMMDGIDEFTPDREGSGQEVRRRRWSRTSARW